MSERVNTYLPKIMRMLIKVGVRTYAMYAICRPLINIKCHPHKMVKYTQTFCRQIADKLFASVLPFCGLVT